MFRLAIFNGAGGLLPQFAGSVPHFANGGVMPWTGLAHLERGEVISNPAKGQVVGGNTTYAVSVTTPTEVLDPTDVARQLDFYIKHGAGAPSGATN